MSHTTQLNWSHRDFADATVQHLLGQSSTITSINTVFRNLFSILQILDPKNLKSEIIVANKGLSMAGLLTSTCERVWQIFDERYPQIPETIPGANILSGIIRVPYGNRKTLGESQVRVRTLSGYLQTDLSTEWDEFFVSRGFTMSDDTIQFLHTIFSVH
jgi:hypothetical protein